MVCFVRSLDGKRCDHDDARCILDRSLRGFGARRLLAFRHASPRRRPRPARFLPTSPPSRIEVRSRHRRPSRGRRTGPPPQGDRKHLRDLFARRDRRVRAKNEGARLRARRGRRSLARRGSGAEPFGRVQSVARLSKRPRDPLGALTAYSRSVWVSRHRCAKSNTGCVRRNGSGRPAPRKTLQPSETQSAPRLFDSRTVRAPN
jgi:hypothetical protein